MEKGIRPKPEGKLSISERESLLKSVVYQVAAELRMNQLQEEGFIDHILTQQADRTDFSKESIKTSAEGWMTMRGWRAMYGGNDIDPR
ncbi:hypothetical protein KJZ63_00500 [Patescibacteria group bacterium]|nr:hypothetical protein [Patescibacteria group bacterium]